MRDLKCVQFGCLEDSGLFWDFKTCREYFIAGKGKITNSCAIPAGKLQREEQDGRKGHR